MPRAPQDLAGIRGLSVGQVEDPTGASGVTAILFDEAARTVVDVRGGASATYDTASLSLDATFGRRWAIFLAGGSLFGLDAARGVRTRLLELGRGTPAFPGGPTIVPLSGAALYDLRGPRSDVADYLSLGYEAARRAGSGSLTVGRYGAGAGATVGKYLGREHAMLGGVGSRAASLPGRGRVGVLVAVNAVGAVRDPASGRWLATARDRAGRRVPPERPGAQVARARGTTLAVVATDLAVDRPTLARVASMVHAGLARTIVPYLSATDGDLVFASSTGAAGTFPAPGRRPGGWGDRLGSVAAQLAAEAVVQAVVVANGSPRRRTRGPRGRSSRPGAGREEVARSPPVRGEGPAEG